MQYGSMDLASLVRLLYLAKPSVNSSFVTKNSLEMTKVLAETKFLSPVSRDLKVEIPI